MSFNLDCKVFWQEFRKILHQAKFETMLKKQSILEQKRFHF